MVNSVGEETWKRVSPLEMWLGPGDSRGLLRSGPVGGRPVEISAKLPTGGALTVMASCLPVKYCKPEKKENPGIYRSPFSQCSLLAVPGTVPAAKENGPQVNLGFSVTMLG